MSDFVQSETATINRSQNSLLPMYKLPVEVFAQILQLDIQDDIQESSHAVRLTQLGEVSSWWMRVVESSPQLWTEVHWVVGMAAEVTTRFLVRSKTLPLGIKCVEGWAPKRNTSLVEFVRLVSEHSPRWRSIRLEVAIKPDILQYLEVPTPKLSKITIISGSSRDIHNLAFKLDEDGSPIQEVALSRVAIPWNSPRLSGLKTLQLTEIWGSDVSMDTLRGLFAASPNLERLALNCWSALVEGDGWRNIPNSQTPIHLPKLTSLWLGDELDGNLFDCLVSFLHADKLTALSIIAPTESQIVGLDGRGWGSEPIRRLVIPILSSAPSIRLQNEYTKGLVVLQSNPHTGIISWPTPETPIPEGCSIDLDTRDLNATWKAVSSLLKSAGVSQPISIDVALHGPPPGEDPETFPVEILDELPTIERITVGDLRQANQIVAHLSGGRPCPNLTVLDLLRIPGDKVGDVDLTVFSKVRSNVEVIR